MMCIKCGNEKDFTMYSNIADFNSKDNCWEKAEGQDYNSEDIIICDKCKSANIVDKTWEQKGEF